MLDVSASIKKHNFRTVRQFERDFVQKLAIGPNDNQVGTIIFDEKAELFFKLGSHCNKNSLLDAIDMIPYYSNFTNIKDALCKLKEGFKTENGARSAPSAVIRFAIVITDGKSNVHESDCGWDTIKDAAEEIRALDVLVYVIAVGDEVDYEEIYAIAPPEAVTNLTHFDPMLMRKEEERKFDEMRMRGKGVTSCLYSLFHEWYCLV